MNDIKRFSKDSYDRREPNKGCPKGQGIARQEMMEKLCEMEDLKIPSDKIKPKKKKKVIPKQDLADLNSDSDDSCEGEPYIEAVKAPLELIGEFLHCIRKGEWELAKKLCRMILIYEPHNREALDFKPLIDERLQIDNVIFVAESDAGSDDATDSEHCSEDDLTESCGDDAKSDKEPECMDEEGEGECMEEDYDGVNQYGDADAYADPRAHLENPLRFY